MTSVNQERMVEGKLEWKDAEVFNQLHLKYLSLYWQKGRAKQKEQNRESPRTPMRIQPTDF